MEFLSNFSPLFRLWRYCGLSPFTMTNDSHELKPSERYKHYSYILIVFQILSLLICLIYTDFYIEWSFPTIVNYIDISIMTSIRLLTIVNHIEAVAKRNAQIRFFRKLQKVDEIFSTNLGLHENHRSLRKQLISDGICWTLELIVVYTTFITYTILDDTKV